VLIITVTDGRMDIDDSNRGNQTSVAFPLKNDKLRHSYFLTIQPKAHNLFLGLVIKPIEY
jgi:hypothetical protein